jgi:hypothetical protein
MQEEIECSNCGWKGKWTDTIGRGRGRCPECEKGDFIDIDGVTEADYRSQNPQEVPKE